MIDLKLRYRDHKVAVHCAGCATDTEHPILRFVELNVWFSFANAEQNNMIRWCNDIFLFISIPRDEMTFCTVSWIRMRERSNENFVICYFVIIKWLHFKLEWKAKSKQTWTSTEKSYFICIQLPPMYGWFGDLMALWKLHEACVLTSFEYRKCALIRYFNRFVCNFQKLNVSLVCWRILSVPGSGSVCVHSRMWNCMCDFDFNFEWLISPFFNNNFHTFMLLQLRKLFAEL